MHLWWMLDIQFVIALQVAPGRCPQGSAPTLDFCGLFTLGLGDTKRPGRRVSTMPGLFRRREPAGSVITPTVSTRREVEDRRIAACPYCGVELKKVPGAATKCPGCGQTMFVRTDHRIQTRAVVTEEQADEIDDGNEALAAGDLATYEQRRRKTYDRLARKFGQTPGANDVRWSMLCEDLLVHQAQRDFGLFRNTRYKMWQILERQGRTNQALHFALDVFYMDSCEPNNLGGLSNANELRHRERGDQRQTLVRGTLTEWVGSQCEELGVSVEQAARDYEAEAEKLKASLKMPRAWSAIWPKCL